MKKIILKHKQVTAIDDLKTRLFGAKIYAEVEISVDANKTLLEAHEIAEAVHESIERNFPNVKHCMVYVNSEFIKSEIEVEG